MSRRVVLTGLGCVTPVGLDVPSTWQALLAGEGGVGPITRFDASELPTRIAAEVKGFDPARHFGPKQSRRLDPFAQYGMAAAFEAWRDAQIVVDASNAARIGVIAGSGIGGIGSILEQHDVLGTRGPDRVNPFVIPMLMIDMLPGQLSIALGLKGPNWGIVSACSTSGHAIGEAAWVIKRGDADVMIAGGSEAGVVDLGVAAFANLRAISRRNDEPERASRPFDRERDGFVIAEGGAMVVLEELEHARERGARIYAELLGYGLSGDAYHVSAPPEDSEGSIRSMQMALDRARLTPSDVDYVNAHGTSTPLNDRAETLAVKQVFGRSAYDVAISSTKGATGHMLGAAGAVEAIVCARAIVDGVIPPTINYEFPDPECDLDYVPNQARRRPVNVALSNSFGFGGHNSTLVLAAYRP